MLPGFLEELQGLGHARFPRAQRPQVPQAHNQVLAMAGLGIFEQQRADEGAGPLTTVLDFAGGLFGVDENMRLEAVGKCLRRIELHVRLDGIPRKAWYTTAEVARLERVNRLNARLHGAVQPETDNN
jgi:hypothetical protein